MSVKPSFGKLLLSVAIDLVGVGSFVVPGLGESVDLAWAPVSAVLVYSLYQNSAFAVFNAVEELVPGTDFIPTATICWFFEKYGVN